MTFNGTVCINSHKFPWYFWKCSVSISSLFFLVFKSNLLSQSFMYIWLVCFVAVSFWMDQIKKSSSLIPTKIQICFFSGNTLIWRRRAICFYSHFTCSESLFQFLNVNSCTCHSWKPFPKTTTLGSEFSIKRTKSLYIKISIIFSWCLFLWFNEKPDREQPAIITL